MPNDCQDRPSARCDAANDDAAFEAAARLIERRCDGVTLIREDRDQLPGWYASDVTLRAMLAEAYAAGLAHDRERHRRLALDAMILVGCMLYQQEGRTIVITSTTIRDFDPGWNVVMEQLPDGSARLMLDVPEGCRG